MGSGQQAWTVGELQRESRSLAPSRELGKGLQIASRGTDNALGVDARGGARRGDPSSAEHLLRVTVQTALHDVAASERNWY